MSIKVFSDLREEQQNIIRYLTNKNNKLQICYEENLKLCKQQEQQINKLASAIEKIDKINKAQDLNQGSRCIEIGKVIKEVINANI